MRMILSEAEPANYPYRALFIQACETGACKGMPRRVA
jgi:hypothetical protein